MKNKLLKTLIAAILNNAIVLSSFLILSNIFYKLTGQWVDKIGINSIMSVGISSAALIVLIFYEKKRFGIKPLFNISLSFSFIVITSFIIAFAVDHIAGSIG